jgi:hypothetical protein
VALLHVPVDVPVQPVESVVDGPHPLVDVGQLPGKPVGRVLIYLAPIGCATDARPGHVHACRGVRMPFTLSGPTAFRLSVIRRDGCRAEHYWYARVLPVPLS